MYVPKNMDLEWVKLPESERYIIKRTLDEEGITLELIRYVRKLTAAGMWDCKKLLIKIQQR